MNKYDVEDLLLTGCIIAITVLLFIGVVTLITFYQDYTCSTTTDIKEYIKNNCERFDK